jgi:uncharacterized repeat protein (TIGR01451 family)
MKGKAMKLLNVKRVAAFGAVGAMVLGGFAGCSSQEHTATSSTSRQSDWDDPKTYGYVPPDPTSEAQYRDRGWTDSDSRDRSGQGSRTTTNRMSTDADSSDRSSSAGGQVFYFPTGDRSSSVIQLRMAGARQVQLGQPYSYDIEVTNLSRSPIADVVVRNMHASADKSASSEGQSALGYVESDARPAPQPRPDFNDDMRDDARRTMDDLDDDDDIDLDDDFDDDIDDDVKDAADDLKRQRDRGSAEFDHSGRGSSPMARTMTQNENQDRSRTSTNRQAAPMKNEWMIGHLNPGETKTVHVEGTAEQLGMINYCMAVEFSPLACTTLEVINPQLSITTRGPEQALICDDIEYTYVVRNTGTGVARNVRVVESLPEGFATRDGKREINLPVGDLSAGQSREVSVRIKATETGEFQSNAIAQSEMGASEPAEFTTIVQQPALQVKVNGPQAVFAEQSAPFEVVVTNTGDGPAMDTVLEFNARGMTGDFKPRNLGRIEPGESKRVSIPMGFERRSTAPGAVQDPGEIAINASARARCAESVSASAKTRMRTMPALLLETIDLTDPVAIGQTTTYQIAVKNQGNGPARNVRINATLPDGLEFVNGSGESRIQADGKSLRFEPIASLSPGATAKWTVQAKAVSAGMKKFELRLQSDDLEEAAVESEPTRLFDPNSPTAGETQDQDDDDDDAPEDQP